MRHLLHLFVVYADRHTALVACRAGRWLLPTILCAEQTRAGPSIVRALEAHGIYGDVVGQWLGRVSANGETVDWLVIVAASAIPRCQPSISGATWTPIAQLRSSRSVIDYQQWAVTASLQRGELPSVPGPFGAFQWIDKAKAWVAEVTGGAGVTSVTSYRTSSHGVVLGCSSSQGRFYFKGMTRDDASEVRITAALSALAPTHFARTVALETRADGSVWWLTAACAGAPLTQTSLQLRRVATLCAGVQQRVMANDEMSSQLPRICLSTAAASSIELLQSVDPAEHTIECCDALNEACIAVDHRDPKSWLPLDLDPANVLLDEQGAVHFIDLDDSYCGPAPVAITTLMERIKRRHGSHQSRTCRRMLYGAYKEAWPSTVSTRARWRTREVAAAVLEAYISWNGVVKRTTRGEVYGALEPARAAICRRLLNAVYPGK